MGRAGLRSVFADEPRRGPAFCAHRLRVTAPRGEHSVRDLALAADAARLVDEPNAGGDSAPSEALSLEVMRTLFGAQLWQTELEVRYFPYYSKKTDYIMTLRRGAGGLSAERADVAVSVTRAFGFREKFTRAAARSLLERKLAAVLDAAGCIIGREGVVEPMRQVLHCFTPSARSAEVLRKAWRQLKRGTRAETALLVTVVPTWWVYVAERVRDIWDTPRPVTVGKTGEKAG